MKSRSTSVTVAARQIDWDYVHQEVNGTGTTIKQIGREVAPEIEYVKFWRAYWEYASPVGSPSEVTIRLDHKPAERVQVDFSDGVWLTDRTTGNKTLAQLFLGVLPFSSHVFGEFVLDQKLPTFIGLQADRVPPRTSSLPFTLPGIMFSVSVSRTISTYL